MVYIGCGGCSTRLSDSPGGKYYKCLECDISLCKFCYEQRAEPKDHEESHNMRMIGNYLLIIPLSLKKKLNYIALVYIGLERHIIIELKT